MKQDKVDVQRKYLFRPCGNFVQLYKQLLDCVLVKRIKNKKTTTTKKDIIIHVKENY